MQADWLCPICRQGFSDAADFIRHLVAAEAKLAEAQALLDALNLERA